MARAKPGGRGNKLAEFRSMTRVNSSGSLVCILTIFLVYRESVFEKKKKKKEFSIPKFVPIGEDLFDQLQGENFLLEESIRN